MGVEIERKFLVTGDGWRARVTRSMALRQGYLTTGGTGTVRVRLVDGEAGVLTIKGRRVGDARPEFEYPIPAADALFMLDHLCGRPQIDKVRHQLDLAPGDWVLDEFHGDNEGLVVAEVETDEDRLLPELPGWLGEDVTADDRYANSALQEHPYRAWFR